MAPRPLGAASFELLFTLAAVAGDMVIEANFHPHSEYELDKLRVLLTPPRARGQVPWRLASYREKSRSVVTC